MNLFESIKKPFLKKKAIDINKVSSVVHPEKVFDDFTGDDVRSAWYDGNSTVANYMNSTNTPNKDMLIKEQSFKLQTYRKVAYHNSDVRCAITEIVNEVVNTFNDRLPISLEINEENDTIKKAIQEQFEKMCRLMDIKNKIYTIVERGYTDGQMIFHCQYNKDSTSKGIKKITMIDPEYLYYDRDTEKYRYERDTSANNLYTSYSTEDEQFEYSREEIVREDFGLYEDGLCISYLEFALKNANILKNLEDLLTPLRFSRSISRRVFNIDVGNLPPKRVAEVMKQFQNEFKYKKFFNTDTGEISNQQHITSMVEDFWFPNRSGGKGTTVDVLDESGNLGELNDILYFSKKLYRSLNVPLSRIHLDENAESVFDYQSTQTSKDDVNFYIFISRLRQTFCEAFKKILKRQVISTGVLKESEWNQRKDDIRVVFVNDNKFVENMNLNAMQTALDIYSQAAEQKGKLYTQRYLMREVMGLSDEDIDTLLKELDKEEKDPRFKRYYETDEEEY